MIMQLSCFNDKSVKLLHNKKYPFVVIILTNYFFNISKVQSDGHISPPCKSTFYIFCYHL